ncbi:MAG: hypothetical protein COA78_18960, partial [Blastopirellula sp.]
ANQGVQLTVTLGGVVRKAVANDLQQWSVEFPALKASSKPITMTVNSSHGFDRTVSNILVGDVWYLTGSTLLTGELAYNQRDKDAKIPAPMPLVREFRRKTSASSFTTPRKRKFETGGGKYRSSWQIADYSTGGEGVTTFAYHFAKTLNRQGIPQGFITMSSGQGGSNKQIASPLSWTSFNGVKDIKNPEFKARLDELLLQYPNSDVSKKAIDKHVEEVQAAVKTIVDTRNSGGDMSKDVPLQLPAFPQSGKSSIVKPDTIPTYAYNWCVSPMTPMAVAGVIWIPSENNIGYTPADYAAELEIYAKSLANTYGQEKVQFYYAQPASSLVNGITEPKVPDAKSFTFDKWPKKLNDFATEMAKLVE